MTDGSEKIKEFFEARTEKITNKIERTPMEKFFVFFLVLITISALGLGYLQFKKNIEEPLFGSYLQLKRGEIKEKYAIENLNEISESAQAEKLQGQDSDLDGLDDYSEIYIYSTSAYLEDSDSDGIWDKQEILAGTDPNCPEGEDCQAQVFQEESIVSGQYEEEAVNIIPDNLNTEDLAQIEAMLLSGEITLEELGVDFPELQAMLDEITASEDVQSITELSDEEKEAYKEELKNLTPQEIRDELMQRGVDESILNQIDDATLMQVYQETLNIY